MGGGGVFVEGVWTPHPPVNLIPDNDWVGETWGVYFSDYDVDELQEKCIASLWLVGSHSYRLVQASSRPKGLEYLPRILRGLEARILALKIGAPLTLEAATQFSWKQLERPEAYLAKHVPDYQPAVLEAAILELAVPLFCPLPRPRTPNPPPKEPAPPPPPPRKITPPPPPPPPKVVRPLPQMRYKSPTPPPPAPVKMGRCTFCDFSGEQEDVI